MHRNPFYEVFSRKEQAAVEEFLGPYGEFVYANFAGHYHFNWHGVSLRGKYDYFVTDATWDDGNTIRVVEVREAEGAFAYEHGMIDVPARVLPGDDPPK